MNINQREKEPDEEFKESIKKLHQRTDETKEKTKGIEAERDQLQKENECRSELLNTIQSGSGGAWKRKGHTGLDR